MAGWICPFNRQLILLRMITNQQHTMWMSTLLPRTVVVMRTTKLIRDERCCRVCVCVIIPLSFSSVRRHDNQMSTQLLTCVQAKLLCADFETCDVIVTEESAQNVVLRHVYQPEGNEVTGDAKFLSIILYFLRVSKYVGNSISKLQIQVAT
jgi:hypothetical protein